MIPVAESSTCDSQWIDILAVLVATFPFLVMILSVMRAGLRTGIRIGIWPRVISALSVAVLTGAVLIVLLSTLADRSPERSCDRIDSGLSIWSAIGIAFVSVCMWMFVSSLLAHFGWGKLVPRFAGQSVADGVRFGCQSIVLNRIAYYSSSVDVIVGSSGISLAVTMPIRLHPPLHILWSAVYECVRRAQMVNQSNHSDPS